MVDLFDREVELRIYFWDAVCFGENSVILLMNTSCLVEKADLQLLALIVFLFYFNPFNIETYSKCE